MASGLNKTIVDELKLIMQDDVGILFEAYLDDTQSKLVELSNVIADSDCDLTRRLAHSIKGSSRNVGASELSDLCESLESAARNEQVERLKELAEEISLSFVETRKQINLEILSDLGLS